ncbi:low affinity immunoglobulin gamma Fc region receptor II-like [Xenopus laevis]|uniref:low affinity immunoglobulin gamma Fc region receptor II-like n=1 Tax=Xenopus laevis TaxID=8355 RepID=UPI001BB0F21C|nr:low affinity immunoglobulin gamma Fc region receptor II-like [Xenopus laevis]
MDFHNLCCWPNANFTVKPDKACGGIYIFECLKVLVSTGYLLLLYTAFYIAKSGAAVRPVVSFSPNWNPIFPGEPVTLTCNVIPTAQGNLGYSWYRGGHRIPGDQQSLVIESVREIDSGVYQCQAGVSERSDSARLDLYYGECSSERMTKNTLFGKGRFN